MKEGIHPEYYQATVTCNCGNTFVTGSTKKDIHVEVCSKCHPFYTGQQKTARAAGRIDKFNKKYGVESKQVLQGKVEVVASQPYFVCADLCGGLGREAAGVLTNRKYDGVIL